MSQRRRGGAGAWFAVLILIGFIAKFFWWLLVGAALVVGGCGFMVLVAQISKRVDQRARECAAIAARADEQHRQIMAGDDRGLYGSYAPAWPPTPPPTGGQREKTPVHQTGVGAVRWA